MSIPLASKRTKISWGFIFALWALLLSAPLVAAGEPEYERKPVSHWLSILRNPSAGSTNREAIGAAFRQANAAVLSIGPAALPYLAEELDDRESVFVQGYRKLRQQLPFSDEEMDVRLAAARAMLDIDPEVGLRLVAPLAELIDLMEPNNWQSPAWAARLLGRIGPSASSAVTTLTGLLDHKYPNVRVAAAEALAQVKPDRKTLSIELLRELLKHKGPSTRLAAATALWRLSLDDAPEIAAVAAELLATPIDIQPQYAARLLGEMGSQARSVLPRLKQALESGLLNRQSRRAIWEAMEAIQQVK